MSNFVIRYLCSHNAYDVQVRSLACNDHRFHSFNRFATFAVPGGIRYWYPQDTFDERSFVGTSHFVYPDRALTSPQFGPPGTGKTLLARAIARESGARMMIIKPSDVMDMVRENIIRIRVFHHVCSFAIVRR
jgi:hypothetical protein